MKKRKLINYLCLVGILTLVFYILHDVVGALNYPGYNWTSQALISPPTTFFKPDKKSWPICFD